MSAKPWYMSNTAGLEHQKSQRDAYNDYAAKRDRYAKYEPEDYREVMDRFARQEAARAEFRAKQKAEQAAARAAAAEAKAAEAAAAASAGVPQLGGSDVDSLCDSSSDSADSDEARLDEGHAAVHDGVQRFSTKSKMTVRNLRNREDIPKYLLNLDVDSAFYDPKSRSLRADPFAGAGSAAGSAASTGFRGDNAARMTGDALEHARHEAFAWEAYNQGKAVHAMANPTAVELMRKQFEQRKAALSQAKQDSLKARYGERAQAAAPAHLQHAASTAYTEYSKDGRALRGTGAAPSSVSSGVSRWPEDVHPGDHSSVWGSWYDVLDKKWGYECCHQTARHVACIGHVGKNFWEDKRAKAAAGGNDDALRAAPRQPLSSGAKPGQKRPRL